MGGKRNPEDLKYWKHIRKVQDGKKMCDLCQKTFSQTYNAKNHVKRDHYNIKDFKA